MFKLKQMVWNQSTNSAHPVTRCMSSHIYQLSQQASCMTGPTKAGIISSSLHLCRPIEHHGPAWSGENNLLGGPAREEVSRA